MSVYRNYVLSLLTQGYVLRCDSAYRSHNAVHSFFGHVFVAVVLTVPWLTNATAVLCN
jgi:hypothetical protein